MCNIAIYSKDDEFKRKIKSWLNIIDLQDLDNVLEFKNINDVNKFLKLNVKTNEFINVNNYKIWLIDISETKESTIIQLIKQTYPYSSIIVFANRYKEKEHNYECIKKIIKKGGIDIFIYKDTEFDVFKSTLKNLLINNNILIESVSSHFNEIKASASLDEMDITKNHKYILNYLDTILIDLKKINKLHKNYINHIKISNKNNKIHNSGTHAHDGK